MVFDTQPEILTSLKDSSKVTIAKNVSELAKQTSHIITMLPNNDCVWGVYTNPDGILKLVKLMFTIHFHWCGIFVKTIISFQSAETAQMRMQLSSTAAQLILYWPRKFGNFPKKNTFHFSTHQYLEVNMLDTTDGVKLTSKFHNVISATFAKAS